MPSSWEVECQSRSPFLQLTSLRRCQLGTDRGAETVDRKLALEPLHDLDSRASMAGPLVTEQQLRREPAVLDRVIADQGRGHCGWLDPVRPSAAVAMAQGWRIPLAAGRQPPPEKALAHTQRLGGRCQCKGRRAEPGGTARMYAIPLWVMGRTRALPSGLLLLMGSAFYANTNPVEAGLCNPHVFCASLDKWRGPQEATARVGLGLAPQLLTLWAQGLAVNRRFDWSEVGSIRGL